MNSNFRADIALGYAQAAAGTFDTAKTLAAAGVVVPSGTSFILIIAEAQAVRWRDDAAAPTAAVGQPLAVGVELQYTGNAASRLQFISQTAGAVLNFTFYG